MQGCGPIHATPWLCCADTSSTQACILRGCCRVADRFILEPLLAEALQLLLELPVTAQQASPLLLLASSLPGRQDVAQIGERAAQILSQQVTLENALDLMELSRA